MQAYVVRITLRGKAHDDSAYALLDDKMGAAQFPVLPGTEDTRARYAMVDYSFINRDGDENDVLREAPDVLKKAKAVANSVWKDNIVCVWAGFHEGGGKFSFDNMSLFSDDI